ncbi:MAG: gluconate 2-dehydrogenase subunit 3 family protein [Candidatus Rokuibacteriota bacterium]
MSGTSLAGRRDLLAVVLDALVPAGDGFPGAGTVALDHVLGAAAASPETDRLLSGGLEAIEAAARGADLAALDAGAREALLRSVEEAQPALFEALVRHAYEGYYSHADVVTRLGLDPRAPQPHGHRIEWREEPDVSRVIARGRIYRQA